MRNIRSTLVTTAAIGAAAVGGAALASAATSNTTSSTTSSSSVGGAPATQPGMRYGGTPPSWPAHGSAAHEDAEKPVTGAAAEQAKSAAVKAAGGGTATSVSTDYTQKGYEVDVKRADGSTVEIHLDSAFAVQPGRGPGGPGGPAGRPGPGAPGAPSTAGPGTGASLAG